MPATELSPQGPKTWQGHLPFPEGIGLLNMTMRQYEGLAKGALIRSRRGTAMKLMR